jgi:HAD superfamily hydrolase (TIGR01509 family)
VPLSAVLWDMDGTLVDTEPYWIECEYALANRVNATWTREHALNLVGRDLLDSARYIQRHMGIEDMSPEQIRDELLDGVVALVEQEIPWRPGARELLEQIVAAGLPNALVTMSYRRFAQPVIDGLPSGTFSVVVTGDEVARGKPHPDPYLRAAELLSIAPSQTIAIEDSPTGCLSAEAAGCHVLAVPNHVDIPDLPGRRRVESLASVSVADLRDQVASGQDGTHGASG